MTQQLHPQLQLAWQGRLGELVTEFSWSPSGFGWAASAANGEIVWNSSGLDELQILRSADGSAIDCLAFSADGHLLAAGGQSGQLLLWDCSDPLQLPRLIAEIPLGGQDRWIDRLVWHPTAPRLAIGCGDRVKIWDAVDNREIATHTFSRSTIFDLNWHPHGESIAIAGSKGVEIWAVGDPTVLIHRLDTDTASLKTAWCENGRYLAVGNLDRTLTIMDGQHPQDPWILQGCPGKIRHLSWLAGARVPCAIVASGKALVLWELDRSAQAWVGQLLEGHQATVTALAAHPQHPMSISGDADGEGCLWSAQGEIEQIFTNFVNGLTTLQWHPQGSHLGMGGRSGQIEIWLASA